MGVFYAELLPSTSSGNGVIGSWAGLPFGGWACLPCTVLQCMGRSHRHCLRQARAADFPLAELACPAQFSVQGSKP